MEFLRSFLRRHLAGKQFVASQNVSCFLRLPSYCTIKSMMAGMFFQIVFFILTPIAEKARKYSKTSKNTILYTTDLTFQGSQRKVITTLIYGKAT